MTIIISDNRRGTGRAAASTPSRPPAPLARAARRPSPRRAPVAALAPRARMYVEDGDAQWPVAQKWWLGGEMRCLGAATRVKKVRTDVRTNDDCQTQTR
jgi:hypothetical protein